MNRSHSLKKLVALASIFTLLPTAALIAQPAAPQAPAAPDARPPRGPGFGHRGPEFFLERMAEALALSDGQIAGIEELMATHKIETAALEMETRLGHETVRKLVESDIFDEAAIREAAQKAADAQIELTVERARLRSEIHAVLTPEQQEKAAALKAERQERRHHFRDGPGDRHGKAPRAWRR